MRFATLVFLVGMVGSGVMPDTRPDEFNSDFEGCWWCEEDCGNGSHHDILPMDPDEGSVIGGTFVNMCNIAYSECWEYHDPCPPEAPEETPAFSIDRVDQIEDAIASGHAETVRGILQEFANFTKLIPEESRITVFACNGASFANLLLPEELASALAPQ